MENPPADNQELTPGLGGSSVAEHLIASHAKGSGFISARQFNCPWFLDSPESILSGLCYFLQQFPVTGKVPHVGWMPQTQQRLSRHPLPPQLCGALSGKGSCRGREKQLKLKEAWQIAQRRCSGVLLF